MTRFSRLHNTQPSQCSKNHVKHEHLSVIVFSSSSFPVYFLLSFCSQLAQIIYYHSEIHVHYCIKLHCIFIHLSWFSSNYYLSYVQICLYIIYQYMYYCILKVLTGSPILFSLVWPQLTLLFITFLHHISFCEPFSTSVFYWQIVTSSNCIFFR